jgi:hypothetical protein
MEIYILTIMLSTNLLKYPITGLLTWRGIAIRYMHAQDNVMYSFLDAMIEEEEFYVTKNSKITPKVYQHHEVV